MKDTILIEKLRAAAYHLFISVAALAIAAYFIFVVWYPAKFFDIAGGSDIFGIVAIVELIVGPFLTIIIFNKAKPIRVLIIDYTFIAILQVTALSYGLYTAYNAKPALLVFSVDRFELVRTIDLPGEPTPLIGTSFLKHGPKLVEAQLPLSVEERNAILFSAVEGKDIHLMPKYYAEYNPKHILSVANSMRLLLDSKLIEPDAIPSSCLTNCRWLPLMSTQGIWTVIIDDATALPIQFLDIDPFPALAP